MIVNVSLEKGLGPESHLAAVHNALEGFVSTVIGDMLFKPRFGTGSLSINFAASPEALVEKVLFVVQVLTSCMDKLKWE